MKYTAVSLTALATLANAQICKKKLPEIKRDIKEQILYNAGVMADDINSLQSIGSITALIPEAADASVTGAPVIDGESGDVDFPYGDFKVLATVGEASVCEESAGEMIVGVPDGLGAYLLDEDTVRAVVQSESYGPVSRYESYPFPVNDGAATFTGSHVQYVDYDRSKLEKFMENDHPASKMVKGMGEAITMAYNLKGELVGPRNATGPTTVGAHYSNTNAAGDYVVVGEPSRADWVMQSLCSAHLEEKHQWGTGIGLEDTTFITNEEWMTYEADVQSFVGLSAHAVDMETFVDYAVGAMTNGGFEKIVEVNPMHTDYVMFSPSGYNGAFGSYDAVIAKRNEAYGNRPDGKPYVKPQNIVPARVYIGVKGLMEDGSAASPDDFLARNGLRYGKMYGFATDMSASGPTGGLWRDDFHREADVNGKTVTGVFTPIDWQWSGEVVDFEHDGSWDFQEQPPLHLGSDNYFWNGAGNDASGCKMEHNSPDPRSGKAAFVQSSTCGYFGHYYLTGLDTILDGLDSAAGELPGDIPAEYYVYQGELDITAQIDLGGKGQYADGQSALTNCDSTSCSKSTFEDIDGFEIIEGKAGKIYAIIQEDSGNDYGERMFITDALTEGTDPTYYFMAMSGGSDNTRMMAGVGIPAGVNDYATSHEFSGISDMSGLLKRKVNGDYRLKPHHKGHQKREADRRTDINDKLILIGLQAHNFRAGVIDAFQGDRGGQWLAYQPAIPM